MALGSSGTDKIQIVVEVDNTGAVKLLGDTEKAIGSAGKAAKESTERFSGLEKGMIALAGTAGAYLSINKLMDAIERGSRVDDITSGFERLANQAGVSAEALRNDFGNALGNTISQVEVMKRSNELMIAGLDPSTFDEVAQAARSLADATGRELAPTLDLVSDALIRGNDRALKMLGVQVDLKRANEEYAASIGTTSDKLSEAQQVEIARAAMMDSLNQKTQDLGLVTNDAADNLAVMKAQLENTSNEIAKAIATNPELNKLLKEMAEAIKEIDFKALISGITSFTSAMSSGISTISSYVGWLTEPNGLIDGFNVLTGIMQGLPIEMARYSASVQAGARAAQEQAVAIKKANEQQTLEVVGLYQSTKAAEEKAKNTAEVNEVLKAWNEEEKKLQAALKGSTTATTGSAKATKELSKEVKDADAQVVAYQKHLEDLAQEAQAFSQAQKAIGDSLASSLGSGVGDAIVAALEGGDVQGAIGNLGADLGSQLGSEAGLAFGGPFGAALGSVLGDAVGQKFGEAIGGIGKNSAATEKGITTMIDGMMPGIGTAIDSLIGGAFGDSAATKARKQADAFFADVFKDLQFSGNQDPTQGIFAGLNAQAQAQYQATGDILTQALGLATDAGLNLGVVLANNNLTLSDLPAIIEASGQSFESLSSTMYQAFYDGELGILALQDRLEELYGIINGGSAFQDLGEAAKAALNSDGRQLLAAIKAIGTEAEKLGISTLPQMANVLVSKFGLAADQVNAIIASMSAAGVTAVNQVANASLSLQTAVGANLSQVASGQAPDNTAVIKAATSSASAAGSLPRASSSRSTNSRSSSRTRVDPSIKERSELLKFFNQAENSGAGKELQDQISKGLISDGAYASGMQALFEQAKDLQKEVDKQEKEYLEALRTGKGDKLKELKELKSAEKSLKDALKGSDKDSKESIYAQLDRFAQKFQGNIDLIQKAAKGLNVSFKDMKEQALDAFMAGSKTFAEAKAALDDASGGKDPAKQLELFKSLGANGGAYSADALQKIAKSSMNAGGTSLDNLSEQLLNSGANREDVQKLFIALKNSGVNSLDQIANAGSDLVVTIGAQLQDLKFPFADTTSKIRDELKSLDDLIQQNRKIIVEADTIISPDLRALLELSGKPLPSGGDYAGTSPGISPTKHKNELNKRPGHKKKYIDSRTGKGTNQQYSTY